MAWKKPESEYAKDAAVRALRRDHVAHRSHGAGPTADHYADRLESGDIKLCGGDERIDMADLDARVAAWRTKLVEFILPHAKTDADALLVVMPEFCALLINAWSEALGDDTDIAELFISDLREALLPDDIEDVSPAGPVG